MCLINFYLLASKLKSIFKLMNSKKNDFNLKRQNAHSSEQHIAPKITKLETYHADTNSNLLGQQSQEPHSTCSQKKTRGRVKIDIEVNSLP